MPLFGLKLGVHERELVPAAEGLWRRREFDFLELYVRPDAAADCSGLWKWYDGPLVLHAPHSMDGFNFARREMAEKNARTVERIEAFRKEMRPKWVVFHPGLDGDVEETFRQTDALRREWPDLHGVMLIENKPAVGLTGEKCLGSSPAQMREILRETGCAFCLDVRHAAAYAASAGRDLRGALEDFAKLDPKLWHAADGDTSSFVDSHGHIGKGNMPWEEIATFWDKDTPVTIECAKERAEMLADFRRDAAELRRRVGRA